MVICTFYFFYIMLHIVYGIFLISYLTCVQLESLSLYDYSDVQGNCISAEIIQCPRLGRGQTHKISNRLRWLSKTAIEVFSLQ